MSYPFLVRKYWSENGYFGLKMADFGLKMADFRIKMFN